ncbi:conserved Plasmodium protein, unknown function [Plasmodium gallinaceum]|uniref:Uncharacterized protein n=1 Tax=Plasmodium gallinaceum TaxID=5849 RepID=A0A1J1GZJ5_PLAGA|nr:conserved Plasmodium protein, unknown function [Plasmodium gallinaceum]CRG97895.1 conserved Plasmodium protein, unknown function [Plasmodium gallinaceum]
MKRDVFKVYRFFISSNKNEKFNYLKKLSYDFYKKSQNMYEKNYEEAIVINENITKLFKEKIYNNQSYILILKGLMNILLKMKEEKKKKILKNMMNSYILHFEEYVNSMNEQDITLLLDIKGKCNIVNKKINELIVIRLNKNSKNTLFYNLNCKSVCIILNNLYKLNIINEKKIIDDIYYFYVFNKYSNYTLKQLIIILHSLYRYGYEKNKVMDFLNYISIKILKLKEDNYKKKSHTLTMNISFKNNYRKKEIPKVEENNISNKRFIKVDNYKNEIINENKKVNKKEDNLNKANDYIINERNIEEYLNKNNNSMKIYNTNGNFNNGNFFIFDKKDKYELIFFYTLSCYNYCHNPILNILLNEITNKIFFIYKEKEICMFINSVSNFLVLKKTKNFEKHCLNEEESINKDNIRITYNLINYLIKNRNKFLKNYSYFSIISIYIFLSKLDYFYKYRNKESFFLKQLFFNTKIKRMEKIFCDDKDLSIKILINFLFSIALNNGRQNYIYSILLKQLNFLIKDNLYSKSKPLYLNENKDEINKFVNFLSIQNIQLLCIIYTYLYIYNILFKLGMENLHFFLFFLNNYNYLNSIYLSQHISSKIHKEINATIFSLKKKKNLNFLLTNECFIFPYYIDIYLKKM